MLLRRELQPYSVLNTTVEFIKELKTEKSTLNNMLGERVTLVTINDSDDERTPYIETLISNDRSETLVEGVEPTTYAVTLREDYHKWIFAKLKSIANGRVVKLSKQYTDAEGNQVETYGELSEILAEHARRTFKINKNHTLTLPNFIRMLALVNGYVLEERNLKRTINNIKANNSTYYLYRTQKHVAEHYRALKIKCALSSCMTHGAEHFDDNSHYVPCLESTATQHGAEVKEVTDNYDHARRKTFAMFTVNVEGYSGGDLWLGLVSKYSPDELASLEDYGFCGRTIVFERDNVLKYVRYYGDERARLALESGVEKDNCVGMQFRAYRSTYAYFSGDYKTPRYITPYIDGENRHFRVDSENVHYDEYGREYYMATVLPYDSGSYNHRRLPRGDAMHGVYRTAQDDWLTVEEYWEDHCCISDELVERGYGRWSNLLGGYVHMTYGETDSQLDIPAILSTLDKTYKTLEEEKHAYLNKFEKSQERLLKLKKELGA